MHVALVSSHFPPHIGGIERFTELLARGLAARGHQVEVVCCRYRDAPRREQGDGYSIRRIPSSYVLERRLAVPYPLPAPAALFGELRRAFDEADLVHVQDAIYAASVAGLVLAHRRRIPSVLTQHVAFVPQGSRVLNLAEQAALATLGRSARLATRVATYNPAVADWTRHHWGLADVRVLPVGVVAPTPGDRSEARRSFGLDEDRFLAVFVGRDVHKKGLDVFLGAADPAYQLVAVTDRQAGTSEGTLLPFMAPERLGRLLACADAFVLPSEGEGFPLSLQEAMAAGLPVVTTHQVGYERFLGPDDVLFVERSPEAVRTALLALASDDDLVRRLGARSRSIAAEHFGVEAFVDAYEVLYDEARSGSEPSSEA